MITLPAARPCCTEVTSQHSTPTPWKLLMLPLWSQAEPVFRLHLQGSKYWRQEEPAFGFQQRIRKHWRRFPLSRTRLGMSKARTAELTCIHTASKARGGKGEQPKTQQQKEARYKKYSYIFHSYAFSSSFPLLSPIYCLPLQNIPSRQVRTRHMAASITTSGFLPRAKEKWIFTTSCCFYFPLDGVQWQNQGGKQFSI